MGKSTDISLSPQQDLHYRGNVYHPGQISVSNEVQAIERVSHPVSTSSLACLE